MRYAVHSILVIEINYNMYQWAEYKLMTMFKTGRKITTGPLPCLIISQATILEEI